MKTARPAALVLLMLALLAGANAATAFDKSTPTNERNAILFSWDGVQRNHLNECLKANQLPNLAKLIKEGHLVEIDVVGHKTDTKAGHTQMLTGYEPGTTGVYSNGQYKPIPLGYTIFEDLQAQFGKDKIVTVMLTGKGHHIGSLGPGETGEVKNPKRKKKMVAEDEETANVKPKKRAKLATKLAAKSNKEGEPWFKVKQDFTVWDGDKSRSAGEVGSKAIGYVDQFASKRFFAFFHFSDPDHAGHAKGENSTEYNDAIIKCDEWLGKIMDELKKQRIYDKTIIFVNADHGFDEALRSHKDAPHVTLATNDPNVTKNGDQRDIVPTLLKEMGADISKVSPKLPGKTLTSD